MRARPGRKGRLVSGSDSDRKVTCSEPARQGERAGEGNCACAPPVRHTKDVGSGDPAGCSPGSGHRGQRRAEQR